MRIEFFENHRGERPVQDFIDALSGRTEIHQVVAYMRELGTQGHRLRRPAAGFLRDGIHELRPGPNRILYAFHEGGVVLLHALRKKSREVPAKDIDLAVKRLQIWSQR